MMQLVKKDIIVITLGKKTLIIIEDDRVLYPETMRKLNENPYEQQKNSMRELLTRLGYKKQ